MSPTEAQKRASNKYHKEHMATLACKLRKEDAEAFKQYAESKETTPNALLRAYVFKCIGKKE